MKLEELKAIRRFLKKELKDAEDWFKLNHVMIEERFYRPFAKADFENNLKGMREARGKYHYIFSLLERIDFEIEKKERKKK